MARDLQPDKLTIWLRSLDNPNLKTLILFRLDDTFLFCNTSYFVFVFYDTFMFFFVLTIPSFLRYFQYVWCVFYHCFFFNDFSLEWLFCLWFGCIVTMEMQSRDYYYHFQTYLPTLYSGLLRPRNIKSNRYGLSWYSKS